MRNPQVFLPAVLSCMVITHLDPHHPLANQKALPVSTSVYWHQVSGKFCKDGQKERRPDRPLVFVRRPSRWYGALLALL